jgi:hypothetical protein
MFKHVNLDGLPYSSGAPRGRCICRVFETVLAGKSGDEIRAMIKTLTIAECVLHDPSQHPHAHSATLTVLEALTGIGQTNLERFFAFFRAYGFQPDICHRFRRVIGLTRPVSTRSMKIRFRGEEEWSFRLWFRINFADCSGSGADAAIDELHIPNFGHELPGSSNLEENIKPWIERAGTHLIPWPSNSPDDSAVAVKSLNIYHQDAAIDAVLLSSSSPVSLRYLSELRVTIQNLDEEIMDVGYEITLHWIVHLACNSLEVLKVVFLMDPMIGKQSI